jgi:penicillin-binding protein 1A
MQAALKDSKPSKFTLPEGMKLVAVNRKTGMQAFDGEPDTIMEAFKPGTGPADVFSVIGGDEYASPEEILNSSQQAKEALERGQGGLF